jgi:hypothetical protein
MVGQNPQQRFRPPLGWPGEISSPPHSVSPRTPSRAAGQARTRHERRHDCISRPERAVAPPGKAGAPSYGVSGNHKSREAVAHPGALQAPALEHMIQCENSAAGEALTAELHSDAPVLLARIENQTDAVVCHDCEQSIDTVAAPNPNWDTERACHADVFCRYVLVRVTLTYISAALESEHSHLNWDGTDVFDTAMLTVTWLSAGHSNCVRRNMHTDGNLSSFAQYQDEHSKECLLQPLTDFLTIECLTINKTRLPCIHSPIILECQI